MAWSDCKKNGSGNNYKITLMLSDALLRGLNLMQTILCACLWVEIIFMFELCGSLIVDNFNQRNFN